MGQEESLKSWFDHEYRRYFIIDDFDLVLYLWAAKFSSICYSITATLREYKATISGCIVSTQAERVLAG